MQVEMKGTIRIVAANQLEFVIPPMGPGVSREPLSYPLDLSTPLLPATSSVLAPGFTLLISI
jgi:hypothetical protein